MFSDLGDQWHWKSFWRESPRRPSEWEHQSLPTGFLQGHCPGCHQDRQTPLAGISKVLSWACRDVGFPPVVLTTALTSGYGRQCGLREVIVEDERDILVTSWDTRTLQWLISGIWTIVASRPEELLNTHPGCPLCSSKGATHVYKMQTAPPGVVQCDRPAHPPDKENVEAPTASRHFLEYSLLQYSFEVSDSGFRFVYFWDIKAIWNKVLKVLELWPKMKTFLQSHTLTKINGR